MDFTLLNVNDLDLTFDLECEVMTMLFALRYQFSMYLKSVANSTVQQVAGIKQRRLGPIKLESFETKHPYLENKTRGVQVLNRC